MSLLLACSIGLRPPTTRRERRARGLLSPASVESAIVARRRRPGAAHRRIHQTVICCQLFSVAFATATPQYSERPVVGRGSA